MSFENTSCPCGGQKPASTMLCDECLAALAGRREMITFRDNQAPRESRRHAAIILISLARSRKRQPQPWAVSGQQSGPLPPATDP